jgi:hypothetical protein
MKNHSQRFLYAGKPADKSEVDKPMAPLLKGAVSLKADWRIHPAYNESEFHHRLLAER